MMFFVYLLASKRNGTLYIGVTNNLVRRVWEHKQKFVEGFTKKYGVDKLVWYQEAETALAAITHEKQIKEWQRKWKIQMIEKANPQWRDLYDDIAQ